MISPTLATHILSIKQDFFVCAPLSSISIVATGPDEGENDRISIGCEDVILFPPLLPLCKV